MNEEFDFEKYEKGEYTDEELFKIFEWRETTLDEIKDKTIIYIDPTEGDIITIIKTDDGNKYILYSECPYGQLVNLTEKKMDSWYLMEGSKLINFTKSGWFIVLIFKGANNNEYLSYFDSNKFKIFIDERK